MKKAFFFSLLVISFYSFCSAQQYDSLITLSRDHMKNDRFDSALAYLDKAAAADPYNVETFMLRAYCWSYLDDNFRSIRELDTAIYRVSDDAGLYFLRAKFKQMVYDYYGALKDLDQCILLDPEMADAWKERAAVLTDTDKPQPALENIDKAISLKEDDPEFYDFRAFLLGVFLNRPEESFYDRSKAFHLKDSLNDRAYELMIDAAKKAQLYDTAIYYSRIFLKKKPGDYNRLWSMASCFASLDNYDSAIVYFNRAIAVRPRTGMFAQRAKVYFLMKKYSLAVYDLDRAISIDSSFGEAYIIRAKVKLEGLKDIKGALDDYNRILAIQYDFGKAYYYRALLYLNELHDPHRACVDMQNAIRVGYTVENGEMERICDSAGLVKKPE